MVLYVYDAAMTLKGVIDQITSLIWTRRYWSCGEFALLVPFADQHVRLLQKRRLIMPGGDVEAAEIQYLNIKKNAEGLEEIEVQGKFLPCWIGKRVVLNPIVTTDNLQNILYRIVRENVTAPSVTARKIPGVSIATDDADAGREPVSYASEPYQNALLACEDAAKASKLGFRLRTNPKTGRHVFSVYAGRDLTAGNATANAPCIFAQEFDNIIEQEYTGSVENLKTTAYVGGEEKEGVARKVAEVGGAAAGLDRDEVFINATDITQTYQDGDTEVTLTDAQYMQMLAQRGASELEQYAETLAFGSKVNTRANLKYRVDYDLGDRVTCVNKRWGIRIDVRITEIAETYQSGVEEIDITFGESLPALLDKIRQITK